MIQTRELSAEQIAALTANEELQVTARQLEHQIRRSVRTGADASELWTRLRDVTEQIKKLNLRELCASITLDRRR